MPSSLVTSPLSCTGGTWYMRELRYHVFVYQVLNAQELFSTVCLLTERAILCLIIDIMCSIQTSKSGALPYRVFRVQT